jgi:hypothetical protein
MCVNKSRSCARANPRLRHSPNSSPFAACFVTRGHLETAREGNTPSKAPFRFYGKDGAKFPEKLPWDSEFPRGLTNQLGGQGGAWGAQMYEEQKGIRKNAFFLRDNGTIRG